MIYEDFESILVPEDNVFHNLKKYDLHPVMQELGKSDFKIIIIQNSLEKYMRFDISNKLIFIDNFQFLSSSLDSLVKNLGKNDFKYLSLEMTVRY